MGSTDGMLLRLVPDRAVILHSRERLPFILFAETVPQQSSGAEASSDASKHGGGAASGDSGRMPLYSVLPAPLQSSAASELTTEDRCTHSHSVRQDGVTVEFPTTAHLPVSPVVDSCMPEGGFMAPGENLELHQCSLGVEGKAYNGLFPVLTEGIDAVK